MKLSWLGNIPLATGGIVLFAFLLIKSQAIDVNQHNRYVSDLRRIEELDARINENVLQARDGLLNYYDTIVNELNEVRNLQNDLKTPPAFIDKQGQIEIKKILSDNIAPYRKKEQLIEQFKSKNAVVKNSLSYFPIAVADLADRAEFKDENFVNHLNNLLRDVLLYNLSASDELAEKIRAQIDMLLKNRSPGVDGTELDIAIAHAKTILQNQNRVNSLVREIVSLPTTQKSEALFQAYDSRYQSALNASNVYRFWLYLFSIFLLISASAYIIRQLRKSAEAVRIEQEKAEKLLLNVLPQSIADRLKQNQQNIADSFAEATVLFADLVGFTKLTVKISPTELLDLLNRIFSAFDLLAEKHGLEKIKTIGDSYMVAGGLPVPLTDHAKAIAEMALDMQAEITRFNAENNQNLSLRIGINSGPVIAGVIGIKKFSYDLWGDTVNTASRMESHGITDRIHISVATYKYLQDEYLFEHRGLIDVKGKGNMTTYFLLGRKM